MSSSSQKKFEDLKFQDIPKNLLKTDTTLSWQGVHLQISPKKLLDGFKHSLRVTEKDRHYILSKINLLLSRNYEKEKVLVSLSVRSSFDLFFQSRKFPPGSEIIMMGINIPDMVQIIKEHGLVPIPIDYNINTMHPESFDKVKEAITDKTKCVLFAYLFGIRYDITEIAAYLKEKKIDVIEDCAQSFCGTKRFVGNPNATMTMFSFGLIKIQTAMYAGLTVIRDDDELFNKMNAIQDTYPMYDNKMLRKRLLVALTLLFFVNTTPGNKALLLAAKMSGQEREDFYVSLSRGFKPGEEFITRFRQKPCAALLHFLHERLENFDYEEFDQNTRKYQVATDAFTKAGIFCPGYLSRERGYWLFPIAVPNKLLFIDYMLSRGINAYRGATQLRYVNPPAGRPECEQSKWLMDHVVYMPIHSHIGDSEFRETIDRSIDCYYKLTEFLTKDGVPKPNHPITKKLLERAKI